METPIDEIIQQEENPSARMEQQPEMAQEMQMPMQGLPQPSQVSIVKEFMGQKHEFIAVVIVFLVLLLSTNGVFAYPLKSFSMAWTEGRLNMVGTVLVSIMGALLFFITKMAVKVLL